MNIWIINEYAGSPYHGMEYRHYYLGKKFVESGHNVAIITASYSHLFYSPPNLKNEFKLENIDGINYLWVKVLKYEHAHDKKRALKWLQFTFKTYFLLPVVYLDKPDIIIVSPMAPYPVISGYKWARKFGAKLVYEVKDIWPLTLIEIGNYSKYHPVIKSMEFFEKFAYRKADVVVSVLPKACEHMKKAGLDCKKFVYIPNGINLKDIRYSTKLDKDVEDRIPKDKFIVAYAGTIGDANALDKFIYAAKLLENMDKIHFLIIGKGMKKRELEKVVDQLGIKNVTFIRYHPKEQLFTLLENYVDVCYIGLKKEKIFKYGVSPNKLFDYMILGKPIVYSINSGNKPVDEANAGVTVEAENPKAIADGILKLYRMSPEERKRLGENGRKYVLENHTYEKLANRYLKLFERIL